jgi:hypothetical protein
LVYLAIYSKKTWVLSIIDMVIYQLVHQGVIMKRISLEGNKVIFRFSFCWDTIKELKALGARFNPGEKNWYLPVGKVHRVLDLAGNDWDISRQLPRPKGRSL